MICARTDRCGQALMHLCHPRTPRCKKKDEMLCYCCAQIRDDNGAEISSKICNIIGSDGGSMPYARDHPWPSTGMMTDVAYRWDVVCDFSAYTGRVRICLPCALECQGLQLDAAGCHPAAGGV